jgi:tRNA(Ile2) C34 agmatinyltransferase TiaS
MIDLPLEPEEHYCKDCGVEISYRGRCEDCQDEIADWEVDRALEERGDR